MSRRRDQQILAILEESDSDEVLTDNDDVEEDHVSVCSQQSDTEQDCSDSEDDNIPLSEMRKHVESNTRRAQSPQQEHHVSDPEPSSSHEVGSSRYLGKDGTVWLKKPLRQNVRTRAENIITQMPGVTQRAKSATSEVDCWNLFFSNDMLQTILAYTNSRIARRIASCQDLSKHTYMKECSMIEFKAFIGLLYIAGLIRSGRQNLSDLWASDGTGVEIFRLVMSEQRFHFIQSCLCFDDDATRDQRKFLDNLAPIRDLFEIFVENCKTAYIPSDCLTIDEMLIAFRGRCRFRQYIPSKPAKYGIKIIALVDAENYYILNLEIYAGKQPTGPFAASNKPYDVVNRIVQPISKSNRNLTFDNWFTSYELVQNLLKEHKLTSVGTLRKNKRQIPPEFTKTRNVELLSSRFGFQKDVTLVSHIPKKNKIVLLMSSLHHDDKIDDSTGAKRKPEINTYYNKTKCGVDVADELCATYDVSRNSKRWPLTIFYAMLNMSGINSGIIHRINNNKPTQKRRHFLKSLGLALVSDHLKNRQNLNRLPREMRKRIREFAGESLEEPPAKIPNVRKRCQVCPAQRDRKTKHTCQGCNKYICPEHIISFCGACIYNEDSN